jgi:hypothetical protein
MRRSGPMGWQLIAAGAVALAACGGGSHLKPQPSATIDLSGAWRVVRAQSDDWDQALRRAIHGHRPEHRRGGMGDQTDGPAQEMPLEPLPDDRPHEILSRSAQGAETLTIRQEPTLITINYGSHDETYATDETDPTVVSIPDGIAERYTGWNGKEFVIEVNAKSGPRFSEHYAIDSASRNLIVVTTLHIGELSLKLRRIFERAPAGSVRDLL